MAAALELSDSTAIIILASIAGVYFSITAACSVVICRILYKKQCRSPDLSSKFSSPAQGKIQYELNDLRGTARGIRDSTDLVPGGRAGKWRQYMSSNQPLNATERRRSNTMAATVIPIPRIDRNCKLVCHEIPAIEEVGAGGEEEEGEGEEVGREGTGVTETATETTARESGLTGDVMSSLNLTASLPGPALAQCGQPPTTVGQGPVVSTPRPVPGSGHIHGHTRSESPVVLQTSGATDTGTSLGHRPRADITSEVPARDSPSSITKRPVRKTHKQLSLSTHSLPRQTTASTTRTLETQISAGGSGILPPANDGLADIGGSRPRLRRYASTASYTSTPSLDPVILVRPRSRTGSRRGSYASNTLGRTSFEQEQYSSITSVEMERNYYTLQARRAGGVAGVSEAGGGREGSPEWTLPTKQTSSKDDIMAGREESPTKLTGSIVAGEGKEESPRWTPTKLTSSIVAGEEREESPRWTPTKLTSSIVAGGSREGSPVWTLPRRLTNSKEAMVNERDVSKHCRSSMYRTSENHVQTAINLMAYYEGQESTV
ncbi:hypothetical protein GBAR_LOCUS24406 [Geodia barretti]|uniref:Uncharacterized protein n=1 Tax=Geodia barretti TaxID=519541 RepID=A0AA35T8Z4_GEOBA|nr:hypothetical protein GBAR_LOCUS24406 [Geodia barretti]